MKKTFLTLIFALLWAAPSFATHTCTTCYIDFVGGNDSWDGTTKAFVSGTTGPWQHVKGMLGATGNASTQAPVAGDSYILKGGVTWPNASLGWLINYSGTGSTTPVGCTGTGCIYIGVDPTYFTGGSWTRPILDGGGTVVGNNSGSANNFVRIFANYVIFDNIEMTGLFWTGPSSLGTNCFIQYAVGSVGKGVGLEVLRNYLHGWSHAAYPTAHVTDLVVGDSNEDNNNVGSSFHDNVIDGTGETTGVLGTAIFAGPPYIYNNEITNVQNCAIVNGPKAFYGNTCENVLASSDPTAHTNGYENNGSLQDVMIYNNLIRHLGSGTLGIWCAPHYGTKCYLFNDVMYDTDVGNVLDPGAPLPFQSQSITNIVGNGATATVTCPTCKYIAVGGDYTISGNSQGVYNGSFIATGVSSGTWTFASSSVLTGTGGTYTCHSGATFCGGGAGKAGAWQAYNLTVEGGPDSNPIANIINFTNNYQPSTLQNNHFITGAGGSIGACSGGWCTSSSITPTLVTNILQTKTTANGQGYTSGQTNPFSPTLGGSTILAGTDSTAFCTAVTASDAIAGAACASSTTAGVIYNTTSHTVTVPFLATLPRGVTPDAGAYQFPASQVATPTFSPGAGTYSGTQNVTLLDSTGGAVICFRLDGITPTSSSPGVCGAGSTTYTIPVVVSSSLTILAIGTEATFTDSAVGTAVYVINPLLPAPVVMF